MARNREVDSLYGRGMEEPERIVRLSVEQAKEFSLRSVEDDVKHDKVRLTRGLENSAKEEADKKAKEYAVSATQCCTADSVAESTVPVVQLPSGEMKGRIIGHEGRNIRILEQLAGVGLIVDNTPEVVVLSGFDPMHHEIAKVVLERLTNDGRIHLVRIEEMVEKAWREVDIRMREVGEVAVSEIGVRDIYPELVKLLEHMRYRTSYRQNALRHPIEVAELFGILTVEVGVDVRMTKRTGPLHDIDKAVDHEIEGSYVQLGMELCREYKENQIVINTVELHHGDVEPGSLIACTAQVTNTISATRSGARRETIKTYASRLTQFEEITNSFEGVEKPPAMQAGREVRIMAVPEKVTDNDMVILAHNVTKRIEQEMQYSGQIRVNMIRESRIQDATK